MLVPQGNHLTTLPGDGTTGVTALAIALLRVVDPRNESETLADFGVGYLFLAPIEVGLLTTVPVLLAHGHGGGWQR